MKYYLLLLITIFVFSGCAVMATKAEDGTMVLKGWGGKSAEWSADGSGKISKEEPVRVPDIMPVKQ